MEKIYLITSDRGQALTMLEKTDQEPHKWDVRMLKVSGMYVVYDHRTAPRGLHDLSQLKEIGVKPSVMKQYNDYTIRV